MSDSSSGQGRPDLVRGLPMFAQSDPEALAEEKRHLAGLAPLPFYKRWLGHARLTGPGWLQSAMTLGGGSAAASLTLGAFFGYKLLWLQPLAMALGVVMLSAMAHQTLSTEARTFGAMRRYAAGWIAWAWAITSLLATVIWHFPQYALAAGMTEHVIGSTTGFHASGAGRTPILLGIGVIILIVSTAVTWSYAAGRRGVRLYERTLKLLVWMIILAFLAVVIRGTILGHIRWGQVLLGYLPLHIPTTPKGIESLMAAFGAAVGINMTFLYPYSLLARGWGREHRGLARFDLLTGMFIPFLVAASLMTIATAATVYEPGSAPDVAKIKPVLAAQAISDTVGFTFGQVIFSLGILGMVLSSIITHMLVCGFAACELFGIEPQGWRHRLCCMIPAVGVLGVVLWEQMGMWIAVRTSAICGILLPIAYVGFAILNNRRDYLGADTPRGRHAAAWNVGMGLAIAATVARSVYFLIHNWDKMLGIEV